MLITSNGYKFWFGRGRFDDYCVFCSKPNNKYWFALDKEYLGWIKRLGRRYGVDNVYEDFLQVYDLVDSDYEGKFRIVEDLIWDLDKHYNGNTERWWAVFYMTMVAECCRENTILNKRIKHLGVYNVLFDDMGAGYTSQYMKKMQWWELDDLMIERGIL